MKYLRIEAGDITQISCSEAELQSDEDLTYGISDGDVQLFRYDDEAGFQVAKVEIEEDEKGHTSGALLWMPV